MSSNRSLLSRLPRLLRALHYFFLDFNFNSVFFPVFPLSPSDGMMEWNPLNIPEDEERPRNDSNLLLLLLDYYWYMILITMI